MIPISVLLIVPLLTWIFFRNIYSRFRINIVDVLVLTFAAIVTGSILLGFLSGSGIFGEVWFGYFTGKNYASSFSAYIQSILQILWYLAMKLSIVHFGDDEKVTRNIGFFVEFFAVSMFFVFLLYVIQTAIDGTSHLSYSVISDHIGPFYNYKAVRFYPILLSASATISLVCLLYGRLPRWRYVTHAIAATAEPLAITLMHSRSALLAVALGYAGAFIWIIKPERASVASKPAKLSVVAFLVFVAGLNILIATGSNSLDRLVVLFASVSSAQEKLAAPDKLKFVRFGQALNAGFSSPLGGGFAQEKGDRPGSGANLVGAESGWLDTLVRGGPFGVIVLWLICLVALYYSYFSIGSRVWGRPETRRYGWMPIAVFLVIFGQMIGANPFINVSDDTYGGPIIWCMFAIAACLPKDRVPGRK